MVEKVNLKKSVDSVSELFKYQEIGKFNGNILNVLQVENRTLDFHIHENSDELFYVIEGSFHIEMDNDIIQMNQGDMIIVPKGVRHRPICKALVKCLLMDLENTLNKENTGGSYQK